MCHDRMTFISNLAPSSPRIVRSGEIGLIPYLFFFRSTFYRLCLDLERNCVNLNRVGNRRQRLYVSVFLPGHRFGLFQFLTTDRDFVFESFGYTSRSRTQNEHKWSSQSQAFVLLMCIIDFSFFCSKQFGR
jgi:hypothetical protein